MQCSICGGLVIWKGPLSNLTHTECQRCGAMNNQIADDLDEGSDDESEYCDDNVVMCKSYNTPASIRTWALSVVQHLSKDQQTTLLNQMCNLIDQGKLRGDISEYLVSQFPELKDQFVDLYL